MKTAGRIAFITIGGLSLVVALCVLLLQNLGPGYYQQQLADWVGTHTGRKLTIEGPVEFSGWPTLRVHARQLALSNAEGFGAVPMMEIGDLEIEVAPLPLLMGRITVPAAKIHGLVLRLSRDGEGNANWSETITDEGGHKSRNVGTLAALALGGVEVDGASIEFSDFQARRNVSLSGLRIHTGPLAYDAPIGIEARTDFRSNMPLLEGDATLQGTLTYNPRHRHYRLEPANATVAITGKSVPGGRSTLALSGVLGLDLDNQHLEIMGLKANGLGLEAQADATLDAWQDNHPGGALRLKLNVADLAPLARTFELPGSNQLMAMKSRRVSLDLDATLQATTGALRVPTLALEVPGAKVTGQISLARLQAPVALQASISAQGDDLTALLVIANQWAGGDARAAQVLHRMLGAPKARDFGFELGSDIDLARDQTAVPTLRGHLLDTQLEGSLVPEESAANAARFAGKLRVAGNNLALWPLVGMAVRGASGETLDAAARTKLTGDERVFSLEASLAAEPSADTYAVNDVAATFLGHRAKGALIARNLKTGLPVLAGELSAEGPDVPQIASPFGVDVAIFEPWSARLPETLRRYALKTRFALDAQAGTAALDEFSADTMGIRLDGELKVLHSSKSGEQYDGKISLVGHDLNALATAMKLATPGNRLHAFSADLKFHGQDDSLNFKAVPIRLAFDGAKDASRVPLAVDAEEGEFDLSRLMLGFKRVSLAAPGFKAEGSLEARLGGNPWHASGQLNVPPFDLRALLGSLGVALPAMRDADALTSVGIDTVYRFDREGFAFNKLRAKLDRTDLQGHLEATGTEAPIVRFALNADQLDLDRYLPPQTTTKARPLTPEMLAASAASLPLEALRTLRLQGEANVDAFTVRGVKFTRLNMHAHAADGELAVEPVTAELYQGKYRGVARIDATGDVPSITLKTDLARVSLEPLLEALTGRGDLAGLVNFEARLATNGAAQEALRKNLAGQATFAVQNGTFRGVDIPAVLAAGRTLLAGKLPARLPTGGETPFRALTGTLELRDGAIYNQDLQLDGEDFRVRGSGMLAQLTERRMDYEARVGLGQDAREIPIRCRGPIAGTSCQPDFKAIGKSRLGKALKDAAREAKGELRGKAEEKLRKLLPR